MNPLKLFSLLMLGSVTITGQIKVLPGQIGIGTETPEAGFATTISGNRTVFKTPNGLPSGNIVITTDMDYSDISPNPYTDGFSYTTLGLLRPWAELFAENIQANYGCISYLEYLYAYEYSDQKLKKDVSTMQYDPALFRALRPVSYIYNDTVSYMKTGNKRIEPQKVKFGFLAQELLPLYPNLVEKDEKSGYLRVRTTEFIPILVQAIQNQELRIGKLETELASLKGPKAKSAKIDSKTFLKPNVPNPFKGSTTIGYEIATGKGTIYITDLSGKTISIHDGLQGNGSVIFDATNFTPGIYCYTLFVDGNEMDTYKLIVQ